MAEAGTRTRDPSAATGRRARRPTLGRGRPTSTAGGEPGPPGGCRGSGGAGRLPTPGRAVSPPPEGPGGGHPEGRGRILGEPHRSHDTARRGGRRRLRERVSRRNSDSHQRREGRATGFQPGHDSPSMTVSPLPSRALARAKASSQAARLPRSIFLRASARSRLAASRSRRSSSSRHWSDRPSSARR